MDIKIELLFNNQWYPIDIENLRKDNIIRVYQDGELVKIHMVLLKENVLLMLHLIKN